MPVIPKALSTVSDTTCHTRQTEPHPGFQLLTDAKPTTFCRTQIFSADYQAHYIGVPWTLETTQIRLNLPQHPLAKPALLCEWQYPYLGDNLNSTFSFNNQIHLATGSYLLNAFWINLLLMMPPVTSVFQVFITSHLGYVKGLQLASFPPASLPCDLLSIRLSMWPFQNIILSMPFLCLK